MADAIESVISDPPEGEPAIQHVLEHHTWESRAAIYMHQILEEFDIALEPTVSG